MLLTNRGMSGMLAILLLSLNTFSTGQQRVEIGGSHPSLPGCSMAVVPNLGPPDVLGLQVPEIPASRGGGEGFWEM